MWLYLSASKRHGGCRTFKTTHNWQNWKRVLHSFFISIKNTLKLLPWNLQGRSSWSKKFQLYFKKIQFLCICEIWAISLKIDILSISASLKFESENSFARMLFVQLWLSTLQKLSFYLVHFELNTDFHPNFAWFIAKSPSFTQTSVQENAYKKSLNCHLF